MAAPEAAISVDSERQLLGLKGSGLQSFRCWGFGLSGLGASLLFKASALYGSRGLGFRALGSLL